MSSVGRCMRAPLLAALGAVVLIGPIRATAQTESTLGGTHLILTAGYLELKDQANHGFVFRGPDLTLSVAVRSFSSSRYFEYSLGLGGGGKRGADSWGFRWYLQPLRVEYLLDVSTAEGRRLLIGPALEASYEIDNYPDLHAGSIQWLTDYSLGVRALALVRLGDRPLRLTIESAVTSLTSRTGSDQDPHHFRVSPGEILSSVHKDLTLQAPWNHTRLSASIETNWGLNRSWGYVLRYVDHSRSPTFVRLSNEVWMSFRLGGGR